MIRLCRHLGPAALLALVLALAGCGGTTDAATGGADLVPSGAAAFVTVDTDLDSSQWRMVDRLASRFPDKDNWVQTAKRELLTDEGVDWDKDVKPALGSELDIAWLDFTNDGENAVALLQPADSGAFERLAAKSDGEIVYEKLDGWYVFSDTRAKVDRFVKASESAGRRLADDSTFGNAMRAVPEDSLMRAFVSGPAVHDAVGRDAQARKMFKRFGRLDWLTSTLRASATGLRSDTTAHGKAGPALKGSAPNPFTPAIAKKVPGDALIYFGFHGSKGMLAGLGENPVFGGSQLGPFADVLRRLDTLLQGENAFYVRPGTGKVPEATFVMEPAKGTDGVKTLDRILRDFRGDVPRPRPTRAGRKIELGSVDVHYANVGRWLVISDLPSGIAALERGAPALSGQPKYKDALRAAGLKPKTQGFLYVDIRGGVELAQRLAGSGFPTEIARSIKPLRSAVEYAYSRPSEIQITFFLQIK